MDIMEARLAKLVAKKKKKTPLTKEQQEAKDRADRLQEEENDLANVVPMPGARRRGAKIVKHSAKVETADASDADDSSDEEEEVKEVVKAAPRTAGASLVAFLFCPKFFLKCRSFL